MASGEQPGAWVPRPAAEQRAGLLDQLQGGAVLGHGFVQQDQGGEGLSFPVPCKVMGQVVNQTSRVLLVCNCVGELNHTQISANATYEVAGGSQCTYQGNLQFQCN